MALKELQTEINSRQEREEIYQQIFAVLDGREEKIYAEQKTYMQPGRTELVYRRNDREMEESQAPSLQTTVQQSRNISETYKYRENIQNPVTHETNYYEKQEKDNGQRNIRVINEMIQTNLQKEVSHITEQVYKKIEKKLQNERKRRGL